MGLVDSLSLGFRWGFRLQHPPAELYVDSVSVKILKKDPLPSLLKPKWSRHLARAP